MRLARDTLRGYVLEEVLAFLIRNTGYRLLVHKSQDPEELDARGNGLVVMGRGAVHQVDVLGELAWIPAFTYPLRLFVEAKFRNTKTGIDTVRELVATLLDVNQNNMPQLTRQFGQVPQLRAKYQYVGAVFSTSGFSEPAMDMALAHGISLIDLTVPELDPVLSGITTVADNILKAFVRTSTVNGEESEPVPEDNGVERGEFIAALRRALRRRLGTEPPNVPANLEALVERISPTLDPIVRVARHHDELFVGMANGPFMLVMSAREPASFLSYSTQHPTHEIEIRWTKRQHEGRVWSIHPLGDQHAYSLSLGLPELLGDWIFSQRDVREAAMMVKEQFFSNITVYHHSQERDLLVRLRFNRQAVRLAAESYT